MVVLCPRSGGWVDGVMLNEVRVDDGEVGCAAMCEVEVVVQAWTWECSRDTRNKTLSVVSERVCPQIALETC